MWFQLEILLEIFSQRRDYLWVILYIKSVAITKQEMKKKMNSCNEKVQWSSDWRRTLCFETTRQGKFISIAPSNNRAIQRALDETRK